MSKLKFTPKPNRQEIENFIDFIEFNRSQRNANKEFLMNQFECGNIFLENNTIVVRHSDTLDKKELEYITKTISQVTKNSVVFVK
jgi:hypothetical protein